MNSEENLNKASKPLLNFRYTCWCLFIVFLVLSISKIYNIYSDRNSRLLKVRDEAIKETQKTSSSLSLYFSEKMKVLERFRDRLCKKKLSMEGLEKELRLQLEEDGELIGMALAFKPYAYDKGKKLCSLYLERSSGTIKNIPLEYDYTETKKEYTWFHEGIVEPIWTDPFFEKANKEFIITYSIPFYDPEKPDKFEPIGVATFDIGLQKLDKLITNIDLGKSGGYTYVLSKDGHFLSHPIKEYVRNNDSINTIPDFIKNNKLKALSDYRNITVSRLMPNKSHSEIWQAISPIEGTNWTIVSNFPIIDANADTTALRQNSFVLISYVTLTLIFLMVLFLKTRHLLEFSWTASWIVTVILISSLVSFWVASLHNHDSSIDNAVKVKNKSSLNSFISSMPKTRVDSGRIGPVTIPLGIYLQSLEFKSSNNVDVTGYIWLKFEEGSYKDLKFEIEHEFILPDAVSQNITKSYKRENSQGEVVQGWYFEATLRQPFDYSEYPFDRKKVWLRFWHKNFDKNVVLVPDINSYERFDSKELPGLDPNIVMSQWDIRGSEFHYVLEDYATNFGINDYEGQVRFPELYYTVSIDRKFLGPFVLYLLPFLSIATLLFAWMNIKKPASQDFLNGSSALLFTVLLAHYSLRESLDVSEIVYMEYFYFFMYIVILILLVLNHLKQMHVIFLAPLIKDDFLVCRLLYWPLLLLSLIVITFLTYY